jgi:cell division protein FtsW (lipid II flippase)
MVGAASLQLQSNTALFSSRSPIVAVGVLSLAAAALHLWLNRFAPSRSPLLLPGMVLLTGIGLLVITRIAANFLGRQLTWLCISAVAFCIVVALKDELRWLRRFKYTWLLLAFALLVATLGFGVNPAGTGARLWLGLGGLFLQPSELLRLFMIAFLAAFFAERLGLGSRDSGLTSSAKSLLPNPYSLIPSFAMWLVAVALLFVQQDLGAAVLLLGTFVSMLYLATGRKRLPLIGLGVLLLAGWAGYFTSARVAQRISIWLNPWADPQNTSFQIVQSLIAIANGGLFGRGLGQGQPDFVPAVHTDFPYAAICEELGLLGAIAVIALFAVLVQHGWHIAQHTKSAYAQLLAGGLVVSMALQVFVILGGNLGLVPLTGVTLPFISYGGSSLLVQFVSIGLLVRIESSVNGSAPYPALAHAPALRLKLLCAALFAVLALATSYWSVVQAGGLVRRNDNPRRVNTIGSFDKRNVYLNWRSGIAN